MTVFIPVHDGDKQIAVKNIEHALWLDKGKVEFNAIIHHEQGCEVSEVINAAKTYFTSVVDYAYPKWTGNQRWPWPQNSAWTRAARFVESDIKDSWFWWEADAVPLRARWLHDIASAYAEGRRPFAGACVTFGGINYMAGVGFYPPNPSELMPQAMLANGDSWDRVAGKFDRILSKTHDISTLIHHVPDVPNTHFASMEDVRRKIPETACLFHKCKDGSLIEVLQGKESDPATATPSVPSVFEQRPSWPSGLFAFPYERDVVYFNASAIEKDGRTLLFCRRQNRSNPQATTSDLAIWELRSNMTVKGPPIIPKLPSKHPGIQYDDAKASLSSGGKVMVTFATWFHGKKWPPQQTVVQLSDDLRTVELSFNPPFGGNTKDPEKASPEKNWTILPEPHSELKYVYSLNPMVVFNSRQKWENPKLDLPWEFGELRGGSPPILVGEHYISIFHSSVKWIDRPRRLNRYYLGGIAFEKAEPHRVTHITKTPILIGSEEDPRVFGGPPCVFCNGAIFKDEVWTLFFGINDEAIGWMKVPASALVEMLDPI